MANALTSRRTHNLLSDLTILDFLTFDEHNQSRNGGKYREYQLRQELELVVNALSETIESAGIRKSIEHLY